MSDAPKSDDELMNGMEAALAAWRKAGGKDCRPKFDAKAYRERMNDPEPRYQWQDRQRRAYGLLSDAGIDKDRCKGGDWLTMVEILARAMAWDMPHGYLISGATGNGKSTLLRLIGAHGHAGRGEFGWRYRSAVAMGEELVTAAGTTIPEPTWGARCLLIDDMGTEPVANIFGVKIEPMHQILDARWNWHERGGRTIITTNLKMEAFADRYGDRAMSRIRGMCKVVKLETPDQRRVTE
jgi:hypothetical protein